MKYTAGTTGLTVASFFKPVDENARAESYLIPRDPFGTLPLDEKGRLLSRPLGLWQGKIPRRISGIVTCKISKIFRKREVKAPANANYISLAWKPVFFGAVYTIDLRASLLETAEAGVFFGFVQEVHAMIDYLKALAADKDCQLAPAPLLSLAKELPVLLGFVRKVADSRLCHRVSPDWKKQNVAFPSGRDPSRTLMSFGWEKGPGLFGALARRRPTVTVDIEDLLAFQEDAFDEYDSLADRMGTALKAFEYDPARKTGTSLVTGGAVRMVYAILNSLKLQYWIIVPGVAGSASSATGTAPASGAADSSGTQPPKDDFELDWIGPWQSRTCALIRVRTKHVYSYMTGRTDALLAAFGVFKRKIKALEENGGLLQGASSLLLAALTANIPLQVKHIHVFSCGLRDSAGKNGSYRYVDLDEGMELAVEFGTYQYVAPPLFPGGQLNGFSSGLRNSYFVMRDSEGKLGFDPFVSGLAFADPGSPVIGGIGDLSAPSHRRAYYRLVYPSKFQGQNDIDTEAGENSPLLFAANFYDNLEEATSAFLDTGRIETSKTSHDDVLILSFTGRSVAVPCLSVTLDGTRITTPLNTTLRHLIQRDHGFPAAYLSRPGFSNLRFSCERTILGWISAAGDSRISQPAYLLQTLDLTSDETATLDSRWDLPVQRGDRIQITRV